MRLSLGPTNRRLGGHFSRPEAPEFLGSFASRDLHKLARPKHRLRQAGAHVLKSGICRTTLKDAEVMPVTG